MKTVTLVSEKRNNRAGKPRLSSWQERRDEGRAL